MSDNCCEKHKHRESEEYKSLMSRLNRIEGQIRGLKAWWRRNATAWIS